MPNPEGAKAKGGEEKPGLGCLREESAWLCWVAFSSKYEYSQLQITPLLIPVRCEVGGITPTFLRGKNKDDVVFFSADPREQRKAPTNLSRLICSKVTDSRANPPQMTRDRSKGHPRPAPGPLNPPRISTSEAGARLKAPVSASWVGGGWGVGLSTHFGQSTKMPPLPPGPAQQNLPQGNSGRAAPRVTTQGLRNEWAADEASDCKITVRFISPEPARGGNRCSERCLPAASTAFGLRATAFGDESTGKRHRRQSSVI